MIDCLLFDLDGTLIDTTDLIFQSYQTALASVLDQSLTHVELFVGYGQPLPMSFGAMLDGRGLVLEPERRAATVDRLIAAYREFNVANHDRLAREFAGVPSTLVELKQRGYTLGLVTSKARGIAERGLILGGIAELFETQVFMEDSSRHKPYPDPLWVALERLGRREHPERAVYIGDSTHDLRAGRAAGVRIAAALWGPFPPESLRALEPDYLVDRVEDLLDRFPSLNRSPVGGPG
ncbi:MAG TPA: HAD-IA family hydrolase [Chloroflexota bacterium]